MTRLFQDISYGCRMLFNNRRFCDHCHSLAGTRHMYKEDENVAHAASYQIQKTQKFEAIENSPWRLSEECSGPR
jgi:hypothetical protein